MSAGEPFWVTEDAITENLSSYIGSRIYFTRYF